MNVDVLNYTQNPETVILTTYLSCRNLFDNLPWETKTNEERISNIFSQHHFGVFEHAYATLMISGISRVTTHQAVRHRLSSYAQVSSEHVDIKKFNFIVPPTILKNEDAYEHYNELTQQSFETYYALLKLGIPMKDARYCIPSGIGTQIIISNNFRSWLHFLNVRTRNDNHWEIKKLADLIHIKLKAIAPNIFSNDHKKHWKFI